MKYFYIFFLVAFIVLQCTVANRIDDDWDILSGRFEEGRGTTLARISFESLINKERRELAQEFWDEVAMPKYREGETVYGSDWNKYYCKRVNCGQKFMDAVRILRST
ncbi:uncharacterized protein UTRI_03628_B [Ustilago trichophora]|uniref:Uncharacterized protein n=1 Tax=Ustilago trichophora TaxID=86804 RepID=A0A5C3E1E9_9BASI|nr:uncharacterized protein UTRI_03628_B [Ustilago trichophora]